MIRQIPVTMGYDYTNVVGYIVFDDRISDETLQNVGFSLGLDQNGTIKELALVPKLHVAPDKTTFPEAFKERMARLGLIKSPKDFEE